MSVSGKYLKGTYGATPTTINQLVDWEVEEGGDDLDATVGNSGGATDTDTGVDDATITLSGLIDTTTGKYDPIRRGTVFSSLKLYRNASDTSAAYTFTSAVVTRSRQVARTRGRVEWTATVKNKKNWTTAEPGA